MSLQPQLSEHIQTLVAARLVQAVSEGEYAFRHALLHEAAYASLLRRDRRAYHQAVAETLEDLYSGSRQFPAHFGDLAYHYAQAGQWAKALTYSRRAGARAQGMYAPHEAIEQFTRAAQAAGELGQAPEAGLFRARGQSYAAIGDFDRAAADYEAALQAARATGDLALEGQALLDLGLLWSGRNYTRAGEYFQQALEQARRTGAPDALAHSLNRLGNWYLNNEQPLPALRHHREALALFEGLQDQAGLANTYDLMGMASYLSGDLLAGTQYYQQAVGLFRALDDRHGLTSSLSTLGMRAAIYQTDNMLPAASLGEAARDSEEALALARATKQRSGEAYALITLAFCLGPAGAYQQALEYARQSLAIAEAIEHQQWQTAAHCTLGALYLDLLNVDHAERHLARALALAQATASRHWTSCASGYLALAHVRRPALDEAGAVLEAVIDSDRPPQTLGQRLAWCARIELALARGEADEALQWLEALVKASPHLAAHQLAAVPRLARLRAEALARLGQTDQAAAELEGAQVHAAEQGSQAELWRLHLSLGRVYAQQGRAAEADHELRTARRIVAQLAVDLSEAAVRDNFERRAMALFPPGATA